MSVATTSSWTRVFMGALAALLFSSLGHPATAAGKSKSIKTEAKFISYDAAAKQITVKVKSPGKKPANKALKLKRGKEGSFNVNPEGSVLTRTSVTLNGQRADITEIPEGQTLFIYWVPDETHADQRYARKIDMVLSDQEEEARDKARLEAEQAAGRVAGSGSD